MKVMEKIGEFFGRFMALIVLAIAALALFVPQSSLWIDTSWVNYLLMVIMFGMGLTMKPKDFALVITRPKEIIIGCAAQFVIMPLLAFELSAVFQLDPALTAGVVLVGTCPGGTSSNVITYFSKGDVDVWTMFWSIITVILIPIALGFLINKLFSAFTQKIISLLPVISTIGICMIVATVVSHNAEKIYTSGALVLIVVILHNLLGYACGFGIGKLFRMTPAKTKALSIEIGMQNSGLATSLAGSAFPNLAMATVPGAVFSVWHNISGAVLAAFYRKWTNTDR